MIHQEIPSPQNYFVNLGLYKKIEFAEEDRSKILEIVYCGKTIDCFCVECGEHSVFTPLYNSQEETNHGLSQMSRPRKQLSGFLEQKFYCSRNKDHVFYISSLISDNQITKVGQYPSVADLAITEIKPFKKILGSHYTEFKKAIGLFANGVGVGSFVYLRRIIENFIVEPAHKLAMVDPGWDESKYAGSRVKEKIALLKAHLPEFLINNIILYNIVSKGIHELSEEDCNTYFPALKESVKMILQEMEAKRQYELRKKELSKELGKIGGALT